MGNAKNVGRIYRSKVESSSKVDKRHQKREKIYAAEWTVVYVEMRKKNVFTNI